MLQGNCLRMSSKSRLTVACSINTVWPLLFSLRREHCARLSVPFLLRHLGIFSFGRPVVMASVLPPWGGHAPDGIRDSGSTPSSRPLPLGRCCWARSVETPMSSSRSCRDCSIGRRIVRACDFPLQLGARDAGSRNNDALRRYLAESC